MFWIFHPRTCKLQNNKNDWKLLLSTKKKKLSFFTAPRFPTCKGSRHVKYNPYNTLESKQVPKSTVKITLPVEMWRGRENKSKLKDRRFKKIKKEIHGKLHIRCFLYKWSSVIKEAWRGPVQLEVSPDHWSPEGGGQKTGQNRSRRSPKTKNKTRESGKQQHF